MPETRELKLGGLSYAWHENAFLAYTEAEYALAQFWRLVSNNSEWSGPPVIKIPAMSREQVDTLLNLPEGRLPWMLLSRVLPPGVDLGLDTDSLPAIGCCASETIYSGDGVFPLDLVAATFLQLTRWEEWTRPAPDQFARHDEDSTLAARQGFRERPVLDEWALVIRCWLETNYKAWKARESKFNIRMTHDIDAVKYFNSAWQVVHDTAYYLVKGKSLSKALRSLASGSETIMDWRKDPYQRAFMRLLKHDETIESRAIFYFMTAETGGLDNGYQLNGKEARNLWQLAIDKGHEIGWHIGHKASSDEKCFFQEHETMMAILPEAPTHTRHHYLAWRGPVSWRRMAGVGILEDSSLGYNNNIGFRCSTAHPFQPFDLERKTLLPLTEFPLILQDGGVVALIERHGDAVAYELARKIISRVRRVGGVLTILIHNNGYAIEKTMFDWFKRLDLGEHKCVE